MLKFIKMTIKSIYSMERYVFVDIGNSCAKFWSIRPYFLSD